MCYLLEYENLPNRRKFQIAVKKIQAAVVPGPKLKYFYLILLFEASY